MKGADAHRDEWASITHRTSRNGRGVQPGLVRTIVVLASPDKAALRLDHLYKMGLNWPQPASLENHAMGDLSTPLVPRIAPALHNHEA